MEIVNPRNLYAGNAVTVDTSPSVKFATQLMAQKQAKDEALNKYFADQLSKANPQGLRQQELQPFFAAKDDLQNYYLAHSQDINHPNSRNLEPYQEYQRKWQTLNNVLYSSKDANARTKEIDKVRSNPNAMDRLATSSLNDFDLHANPTYVVKDGKVVPNEYDPVTNPTGHKEFDMNFHFNPKEYKAQELENLYGTFGKGLTPTNTQVTTEPVTNPDGTKSKYNLLQTTKLSYNPDQLRQVGQTAKDAYSKDNSLQFTFEKNNPFDPNNPEHTANFDALNAIHNKYLGGDIKDNSDLYAASVIARKAQEEKVSTKTIKNEDAEKNFQTNKMFTNDALIRGRQKNAESLKERYHQFTSTNDTGKREGILNDIVNNSFNKGTNKTRKIEVDDKGNITSTIPVQTNSLNIDGKEYKGKFINDVPNSALGELVNKYQTNSEGVSKPIFPDAVFLTEDKQNIIPVYFDKKKPSGSMSLQPYSTPIPIQRYKAALSKLFLTKKDAGEEVTDQDFSGGDNSGNNIRQNTRTTTSESGSKTIQIGKYKLPVIK